MWFIICVERDRVILYICVCVSPRNPHRRYPRNYIYTYIAWRRRPFPPLQRPIWHSAQLNLSRYMYYMFFCTSSFPQTHTHTHTDMCSTLQTHMWKHLHTLDRAFGKGVPFLHSGVFLSSAARCCFVLIRQREVCSLEYIHIYIHKYGPVI